MLEFLPENSTHPKFHIFLISQLLEFLVEITSMHCVYHHHHHHHHHHKKPCPPNYVGNNYMQIQILQCIKLQINSFQSAQHCIYTICTYIWTHQKFRSHSLMPSCGKLGLSYRYQTLCCLCNSCGWSICCKQHFHSLGRSSELYRIYEQLNRALLCRPIVLLYTNFLTQTGLVMLFVDQSQDFLILFCSSLTSQKRNKKSFLN